LARETAPLIVTEGLIETATWIVPKKLIESEMERCIVLEE
jgi:hypothetical protein